tara:strand:- start:462 stop:659 length:198 start_codon:yes stop_codon:yes gene_type:complete
MIYYNDTEYREARKIYMKNYYQRNKIILKQKREEKKRIIRITTNPERKRILTKQEMKMKLTVKFD